MTSSRIVRGTKGRVFLYICTVLFITGLIACYNNVRVHLDELQKTYDLCKQEQDNLSTQLQVIYDYKQRLEKSLKTEKADHQRTKAEFEAKINEEKLKNDKVNGDSKLRFSTLQQHYNLLQTQHDDFKEECSKIQRGQLDEINNLQAKLKEVQEELKRSLNDKENSVQHLKTQNQILKEEQEKLKVKLQTVEGTAKEDTKRTENTSIHFSKLVPKGDSQYVIKLENDPPKDHAEFEKNVIAEPSNIAPPSIMKSSTPTSIKGASMANLNGPAPLKYPSATPESLKRSTSKESKVNENILPMPYSKKLLPKGFVAVPQDIIEDNKLEENVQEANLANPKPISDKDKLNQSFNNVEIDMANEVFDIPQNVKDVKEKGEELAPDEKEPDYHLDDGDDDLDDANPGDRGKDEAVRH